MAPTATAAVPHGSRRPIDSAFKQQKLKAWQPILTPKYVISCFAIIGAVFIPIGVAIMMASKDVLEVVIPYGGTCKADKYRKTGLPCIIPFTLSDNGGWNSRDVFVYYQLDNFYQNHRRYVQSRAARQLSGDDMSIDSSGVITSPFGTLLDCQNFADKYTDSAASSKDFSTAPSVYNYPCGLVATSMFNDTIYVDRGGVFVEGWKTGCDTLPGVDLPPGTPCPHNAEGVAWPSDVDKKFRSPGVSWIAKNCRYVGGIEDGFIDHALYAGEKVRLEPVANCTLGPSDFTGPRCKYRVHAPRADGSGFDPNRGIYNCWHNVTDQDFMVWMRVAALPSFRKLFRKIPVGQLRGGASYNLTIIDRFPVEPFGGSKSVVLSTVSWMGGRNDFLGAGYVAVGAICVGLALVFLVAHLVSPRKLGDPAYLDFNK